MISILERLGSWTPDVWTAVFTGISTLIVLVGTYIAVRSLVLISHTQQLEAVTRFFEYLGETSLDREFVCSSLPLRIDGTVLPREDIQRARNVVNFLNRVGLMLDNRLLSPTLVMSICHTVIIRCCHVLDDFVQTEERRIGGRYGRRLKLLEKRAQRYHDVRPQHRITQIKLYRPTTGSIVIYQTKHRRHIWGIAQRIYWRAKDLARVY